MEWPTLVCTSISCVTSKQLSLRRMLSRSCVELSESSKICFPLSNSAVSKLIAPPFMLTTFFRSCSFLWAPALGVSATQTLLPPEKPVSLVCTAGIGPREAHSGNPHQDMMQQANAKPSGEYSILWLPRFTAEAAISSKRQIWTKGLNYKYSQPPTPHPPPPILKISTLLV